MQAYREIYARYREIYARMDETLASAGGTNFAPLADDLSGLTRSADSAEQLTGLQRGEFPVAGPGSTHPPAQSGADVVHHAGGLSDAHPPVPGLDRPHTGSSEAPSWHQMFSSLTKDFHDYRWSGNQPAADAHQAAIDAVADMVLTAFTRTGGNVEELPPARYNFTQAMVIRHKLDDNGRPGAAHGRLETCRQDCADSAGNRPVHVPDRRPPERSRQRARHSSSARDARRARRVNDGRTGDSRARNGPCRGYRSRRPGLGPCVRR